MPTLVQQLFMRQNRVKKLKTKGLLLYNMHPYPTRTYSLQDHMDVFEFPKFSAIYIILQISKTES